MQRPSTYTLYCPEATNFRHDLRLPTLDHRKKKSPVALFFLLRGTPLFGLQGPQTPPHDSKLSKPTRPLLPVHQ